MVTLRHYQKDQLTYRLDNYVDNVCIQSPTGTGKGRIIEQELIYNLATAKKTLVLVPKQELTYNISRFLPNDSTVAYSGYTPQLDKRVFVCTYQSALKYAELYKPDRLISDECHGLVRGGIWSQVVKRLGIPHTGYTATPNRLDGQGLYPWFSKLSTSHQTKWFIDNHFLAPYKLYTSKAPIFSESTDALDIQSILMIPKISDTVQLWLETAYNKKTIAFTTSRSHSLALKNEFLRRGIVAETVDSKTPLRLRNSVINSYLKGFITVLINVNLFTEGVDMPDVDCVLLDRFTYSTARYLQMVGRGLRYQLYKVLTILDTANNCFYHGSPSTAFYWSLEGEPISIKTNQDTLHIHCEKCDIPLVHKSQVKITSNVCCLECGTVNTIYEKAQTSTIKKSFAALHNLIPVEKLHLIENDTITILSKIAINKKMKLDLKINTLLSLDIDMDVLKKMLIHLGIRERDIAQYVDAA